jgi:hypothetical protein
VKLQWPVDAKAGTCGTSTDARLAKTEHADAERLFVIALGAYSAGKDVVIGIDATGCSSGFPRILSIRAQ